MASFGRLQAMLKDLGLDTTTTGLPAAVKPMSRRILQGTGTPEAVVTAPIGTLYINLSGGAATTLYVKTSGTGNTGWTAK